MYVYRHIQRAEEREPLEWSKLSPVHSSSEAVFVAWGSSICKEGQRSVMRPPRVGY